MKPVTIQQINDEVAIAWDDGQESYITLARLRQHCPCAACAGERDLLGNVYKPALPEGDKSRREELRRINFMGGYAVQFVWGDGHDTGLYSFAYLRQIAAETV